MSFISHYRISPRPDAPAKDRTLRDRLAAATQIGAGATVLVALIGVMAMLVALVDPRSRVLTRTWREGLVATMGQPMAQCVNFRMSQRVSDREIEAALARTGGDPYLDPRVGDMLKFSVTRCRVQSLLGAQ